MLLRWASALREVDAELAAILTRDALEEIVALVPDEWLDAPRNAYVDVLSRRLESPREWVEEAVRVRTARV